MAEYFNNPEDLHAWVKSRGSASMAAQELMTMIDTSPDFSKIPDDQQDIFDSVNAIFGNEGTENASEVLFGVLAKHNITKLTKQAKNMRKQAEESRQRNDWTRNTRNKWNRVVDAYNENTPWRVGRDKYYDFTHYATDEIKFDEDPNHIYSGESIWRTYVMDKFYRDYQDKSGHVVGGYINDRFHVFPTAGTPANPDVPRDGGNPMELADGERTRQPRPHQYSTERRLEEARGTKMTDLTASTKKFEKVIKVASVKNLDEAQNDRVYNIFRDTLDMREAGIEYETMIDAISEHYGASVMGVAQIDQKAQKLVAKHAGIGYSMMIKKAQMLSELVSNTGNLQISDPNGANATLVGSNNQTVQLDTGTVIVSVPNSPNTFEIVDHPANAQFVGNRVSFPSMDFQVSSTMPIQDAAAELGLNEDDISQVADAVQQQQQSANVDEGYTSPNQDFPVTDLQ